MDYIYVFKVACFLEKSLAVAEYQADVFPSTKLAGGLTWKNITYLYVVIWITWKRNVTNIEKEKKMKFAKSSEET